MRRVGGKSDGEGEGCRGRRMQEGSGRKTYPLAIAPTKTATECVSGRVGRNCDSRIVGASALSAILISILLTCRAKDEGRGTY